MHPLTSIALAAMLGAVGWTLAEYGLHRFVFHGPSPTRPGAVEHRRHHAEVDYFAPWWQKGGAAAVVMAAMLPASIGLAGVAPGAAFSAGFVLTYLLYEVLHRTAHTRPPRGAYGRWRRRNHFAHHFMDPRRAQGVTTPLWDVVFGTRLPVERVRVPRRLAMPWLVDARGAIDPAFAADYELVGSAHRDDRTRRADAEAARENRRPPVDAGATAGDAHAEGDAGAARPPTG